MENCAPGILQKILVKKYSIRTLVVLAASVDTSTALLKFDCDSDCELDCDFESVLVFKDTSEVVSSIWRCEWAVRTFGMTLLFLFK